MSAVYKKNNYTIIYNGEIYNADELRCELLKYDVGFKTSCDTEVVLYYSNNFFGTADAICFRNNMLRIHDLKTGRSGKIEDHIEQLEIYAALFCLEYKYKPDTMDMELRLYKQDEVLVHHPDPEKISEIMDTIIHFDELIEKSKLKEV